MNDNQGFDDDDDGAPDMTPEEWRAGQQGSLAAIYGPVIQEWLAHLAAVDETLSSHKDMMLRRLETACRKGHSIERQRVWQEIIVIAGSHAVDTSGGTNYDEAKLCRVRAKIYSQMAKGLRRLQTDIESNGWVASIIARGDLLGLEGLQLKEACSHADGLDRIAKVFNERAEKLLPLLKKNEVGNPIYGRPKAAPILPDECLDELSHFYCRATKSRVTQGAKGDTASPFTLFVHIFAEAVTNKKTELKTVNTLTKEWRAKRLPSGLKRARKSKYE
jgi:hypothetical protein